VAAAAIPTHI